MVIVSPLSRVVPLPKCPKWLINGGDRITTEPSPGMILQVAVAGANCSMSIHEQRIAKGRNKYQGEGLEPLPFSGAERLLVLGEGNHI